MLTRSRLFASAIVLSVIVAGCGDDDDSAGGSTTAPPAAAVTPTNTPEAADTPPAVDGCPAIDGSSERVTQFDAPPPMCIDPATSYTATVTTNLGDFTIELDTATAPNAVNNFVVLARYHYFDDTPCHRIIPGFMAQCGDPSGTGRGGPGYQFDAELPATSDAYTFGAVAMANAGGNPDTQGSQFFVVTAAGGYPLPPSYTVFGQVTASDETLTALDAAGNPDRAANGMPPLTPVTIESVTITES